MDDEKYDRKTLFTRGFAWLGDLVARTVEKRLDFVPRTHLRPPGALVESLFLSTCEGSGACVRACPYGAIRLAGPPGAHTEGTPVITPASVPCYLCVDVPCAKACPSGALVPIARADIKIGVAVVTESACFAHQGAECGSCLAACPVGTAALFKDRTGPAVNVGACTGCGQCTHVCPTRPRAIRIKPS